MISLCMIVKNEERMLGRCLDSAKDCVDEIIIVDTGSEDNTIDIAQQFGAKIIHYAWNDDFAAARNYGLEQAKGSWILYLDADEELEPGCCQRLKALTNNTNVDGYYFQINNLTDTGETLRHINVRMFRNHPRYRFTGKLHEQILDAILDNNQKTAPVVNSGINIFHYGYLTAEFNAKNKAERNYRINKLMVEEEPENPYYLYTFGNSCLSKNDVEGAAAVYSKALEHLNPRANYTPSLFSAYISCLIKLGQHGQAQTYAEKCRKLYPDYVDIYYLEGTLYRNLDDIDKAQRCFEKCISLGEQRTGKYTTRTGVGSFMPMYQLAQIYNQRGDYTTSVIFEVNAQLIRDGKEPINIQKLDTNNKLKLAVNLSLKQLKQGNISTSFYMVLGRYFLLNNELELAHDMIAKALDMDANLPKAREMLSTIYYKQALEYTKSALSIYSTDAAFKNYLDKIKTIEQDPEGGTSDD